MPAGGQPLPGLLVSAGEASGDRMAAAVVAKLAVRTYGLGGPCLAEAGTELCSRFDGIGEMGLWPVAGRAAPIALGVRRLWAEARRRPPQAALLVGYSELNARLGRALRRLQTPVLWMAPPQIWAWRPARAYSLGAACTRMAVILPFEDALWRRAGVEAIFVGHPSLDGAELAPARTPRVGRGPKVALLPGSRPHEVRAHLPAMLGAVDLLRRRHPDLRATLVCARSLDGRTRSWLTSRLRRAAVPADERPGPGGLSGADVAIVASGTATIDAVVAGVPPVIVYRTDPVTWAAARSLVRVASIGLPNLVLGERAFFELVQQDATAPRIAQGVDATLARRDAFIERCERARDRLCPPGPCSVAEHTASLLYPWLGRRSNRPA